MVIKELRFQHPRRIPANETAKYHQEWQQKQLYRQAVDFSRYFIDSKKQNAPIKKSATRQIPPC
jgi:hypothetical protein